MLKVVIIGLWVCLVSIGGVYMSVRMSQASASPEATAPPPVLTTIVRGSPVTLPVIHDGAVDGYFIGKFSLTVDSEKSKKSQLPMDALLTDELFRLLMGDKLIDLKHVGTFDQAAFRTKIKDGINAKLGDTVVSNVLIEQLDYMSKDTIKTNTARRGSNPIPATKIVEGVAVDAPAAPASH